MYICVKFSLRDLTSHPISKKGLKHEKTITQCTCKFFWQFIPKNSHQQEIFIAISIKVTYKIRQSSMNNDKDHWPQKNRGLNIIITH